MDIFGKFSIERFVSSLQYMWQGMLCIFIVIGVIILATVAMNSIFAKLADKKKEKESQE
ncbi:MAG: hypothetical protein IJD64_04750 [Clostridia bacterium]|nr:hypothetical protein [Clostridia bacterium]